MNQRYTIYFSLIMVLFLFEIAKGQASIAEQDFDSGDSWGYTPSISTFDDGWDTSYFGIININTASPLDKEEFSNNIFGENDLNSTPNGTTGFATITFDEIDISSVSNVEISFDYQVVGYNADDDDVRYEVYLDGIGQGEVDLHDGASDPDNSEDSVIITVPNSVDNVYLIISIRNNGQTGYSGFDNFEIAEASVKPEPTTHVTNFTATSNSISSIDLNWSDATAGTTPENYLIIVNQTGSFSIPNDGAQQADDTDLTDGSGILNIAQGIETATFSELQSNSTYFFKIYPYTNLGSKIDFKTDGTIPTANVSTLQKPDLVLNEILADPNSDANGDGNFDTSEDEFLEFVNIGQSDLDITGWIISDGSDRHIFPPTTLKPNQPVVIFEGGSPMGDFGGAIVQTSSTSNLNLNNGGETITVKNASNQILIEESYGYVSDQSVTRSPDLIGNFKEHTSADTEDNSEFSPGTRIDGHAFYPWVKLTGSEGWRMLSTPTSNNTYNDLIGEIWTQCSEGANYNGSSCDPNGAIQPNVQYYDANTGFEAVSDLDTYMPVGKGFIVYVYEDEDFDFETSEPFPKELEMSGSINTADLHLTTTSQPALNEGKGEATLLGNPFLIPIDWDNLNATADGLTGVVYIYDHSYGTLNPGDSPPDVDVDATGTTGNYRTWNGTDGSLTEGVIAPFQGFWVVNEDAESPLPSLTISKNNSVQGGTFLKKGQNDQISIHLRAESDYMFNDAFLSFHESGKLGKDNQDGLELTPLDHGDYITLSTEVEGTQMDINNLPLKLQNTVEIPLHIQAYKAIDTGWSLMGGEIGLFWQKMNTIPPEWKISLTDKKLNRTINMKNVDQYVFEAEKSRSKITVKKPSKPFNHKTFQKEKPINKSRFLITIDPNLPQGMINNNIPDRFSLEQNYPNPFNSRTTIKFKIAETSHVTLNIYNLMGQRIATLLNEERTPGSYEIAWDAKEMASGIYYYRLTAGGIVFNKQMTLVK